MHVGDLTDARLVSVFGSWLQLRCSLHPAKCNMHTRIGTGWGKTVNAAPRAPKPIRSASDDEQGGHVVETSNAFRPVPHGGPAPRAAPTGSYSGVWLSRYEYHSSGRGETFTGRHYVVLLQHGDRLTVRSLLGSSDAPLTMDLTVDGNVVTGTWVEQTAPQGYYRGARYHGAIQLLAEPAGRRLAGKWIGFGKEMDVNTGPWELVFQDASTNKATLAAYDRRPDPEQPPAAS